MKTTSIYTLEFPKGNIRCKLKLSKSLTGIKKNIYKMVCPHYGKEGWSNAMRRWHFNNCKLKISI